MDKNNGRKTTNIPKNSFLKCKNNKPQTQPKQVRNINRKKV